MHSAKPALVYRRILLKLSGEALMGDGENSISPAILQFISTQIKELVEMEVQIGLVIGGGNIFRGVDLAATGIDRVTADQMGMLATLMNALALRDNMHQHGIDVCVMSALNIPQVCAAYNAYQAREYLSKNRVVVFAAGTGNPFFTTDTAASLRGIEIGAQIILKGTKVDGVYSADPKKDSQAVRYEKLGFDEVINKKLAVMDVTAMIMCRDFKVPIRVFNMNKEGAVKRIVVGEPEGTIVI